MTKGNQIPWVRKTFLDKSVGSLQNCSWDRPHVTHTQCHTQFLDILKSKIVSFDSSQSSEIIQNSYKSQRRMASTSCFQASTDENENCQYFIHAAFELWMASIVYTQNKISEYRYYIFAFVSLFHFILTSFPILLWNVNNRMSKIKFISIPAFDFKNHQQGSHVLSFDRYGWIHHKEVNNLEYNIFNWICNVQNYEEVFLHTAF